MLTAYQSGPGLSNQHGVANPVWTVHQPGVPVTEEIGRLVGHTVWPERQAPPENAPRPSRPRLGNARRTARNNVPRPEPRQRHEFFVNVLLTYSEQDFRCTLRVTWTVVEVVLERLRPFLVKGPGVGRRGKPRASPELHLASTLHHLAHGTPFINVGHLSGHGEFTAVEMIYRTCTLTMRHIYPEVVYLPSAEFGRAVLRGHFHELAGMPNIISAIDGSFIRINAPSAVHGAANSRGVAKKMVTSINIPHGSIILGDKIYPDEPCLITPYKTPPEIPMPPPAPRDYLRSLLVPLLTMTCIVLHTNVCTDQHDVDPPDTWQCFDEDRAEADLEDWMEQVQIVDDIADDWEQTVALMGTDEMRDFMAARGTRQYEGLDDGHADGRDVYVHR
ncbi:hypothetical protein BDK51DRAFT_42537 [Blyttiomyces helicus]|uniref:DDE Tnp4 domain-containing protein n=1 Tax=Blyttiomyces helicus TaxID=388810 RepID=A0A4P9WCE0_9FUNG|nr:hypothetical protein BDK51DRAFT_42537 [Blyttiomyces helicus]|eukprot:RKO90321.1 hypothetical protein BDK51DRAFT_42537 [Blyttiomyces helicus]